LTITELTDEWALVSFFYAPQSPIRSCLRNNPNNNAERRESKQAMIVFSNLANESIEPVLGFAKVSTSRTVTVINMTWKA
jgi:hypothetical protein